MKKTLCVAGVFGMLALPSAAQAEDTTTPSPKQAAQAACKAERAEVGKAAFRQTYGTGKNHVNAHRNCVRARTGATETAIAEAKSSCKSEQDADRAAFEAKYGTNKNKRNAYGKCVSAQSKEAIAEETEARVNASKACKAERDADPAAFKAKYGTNKNKSNAFGKCVSTHAKAQNDEQEAPAPAPAA